MKSNVPATNRRQQQGNVRSLLTPEMRQHIRDLKRGLVQCGWPLLEHLDQRFRSSNHIRPPCRAYRPRCERRAPD